jgi:NADH-quinone oxidoreductase subunit H
VREFASPPLAVGAVGVALVLAVYVTAVLDRSAYSRIAYGSWGLRQAITGPLATAALLTRQARRTTERPDATGWAIAPALLIGLAAVALAMVPLAPNTVAADPSTGFVVFSAAVVFVMIAVFLHGWSPNSAMALHGAYRFGAAALSFQIPFLLAMLATALPAESLSIVDIVVAQESVWNVVRQPLGLPIYLVVGLAVSFWGPLNFSDASDLASGTSIEDSGIARLLWRSARLAMLFAVAAMGAAGFLGGWWGPVLPGAVWMIVKSLVLLGIMIATGHLVPRIPIERFVVTAWAVLIPLALVNIFVSGAILL